MESIFVQRVSADGKFSVGSTLSAEHADGVVGGYVGMECNADVRKYGGCYSGIFLLKEQTDEHSRCSSCGNNLRVFELCRNVDGVCDGGADDGVVPSDVFVCGFGCNR